jgi:GTP cyclohydrolase I
MWMNSMVYGRYNELVFMGIILIYELTFTSLGNHHLVGSNGPAPVLSRSC